MIPEVTEIKYPDSRILKDIFKVVEYTQDEPIFRFRNGALNILEMDSSRVSMIHLSIPKELFDTWIISNPDPFCLNLNEVVEIFKNVRKNETVSLAKAKRNDADCINNNIKFTFDDMILKREFLTQTLEFDSQEEKFPILKKQGVKITLHINTFNDALKDHIDHFKFVTEKQGTSVYLKSYNDCMTEIKTTFQPDTYEIERNPDSEIKATFSVNYVKDFIKLLNPICKKIQINYATDEPIKISAIFTNPKTKGIILNWYLAPRIEVD